MQYRYALARMEYGESVHIIDTETQIQSKFISTLYRS